MLENYLKRGRFVKVEGHFFANTLCYFLLLTVTVPLNAIHLGYRVRTSYMYHVACIMCSIWRGGGLF